MKPSSYLVGALSAALIMMALISSPVGAKENNGANPTQGNERSECRRMPGAQASSESKERKGKPETPPGQQARDQAQDGKSRCGVGALPQDD